MYYRKETLSFLIIVITVIINCEQQCIHILDFVMFKTIAPHKYDFIWSIREPMQ